MIPKIITMFSGEKIICGVSEVKNEETGQNICLQIKCPYILTLASEQVIDDQYSVNFIKWNPYSADNKYNIPYNAVVTVSDVEPSLLEVYLERFGAELYYEDDMELGD